MSDQVSSPATAVALAQIERLAAEDCEVLVLGPATEINDKVVEAIKAKVANVRRVTDESGSAELLAKAFYQEAAGKWNTSGTFILATSADYADTLAISPYAYASKTPIFYTNEAGLLSDEVKTFLTSGAFERVVISGGEGVVLPETEKALTDAGLKAVRLCGDDRYLTSAEIARWVLGKNTAAAFQPDVLMSVNKMGVATGDECADALVSVDLLGRTKGILLLASDANASLKEYFEDAVEEFIVPAKETMVAGYIFGGEFWISKNIEDTLNATVNEE